MLVHSDLDKVYADDGTHKEEKEKTEKILSKLHAILESDSDSIIENREVFTQILAAVDKETISLIFKAPRTKAKTSSTDVSNPVPLSNTVCDF